MIAPAPMARQKREVEEIRRTHGKASLRLTQYKKQASKRPANQTEKKENHHAKKMSCSTMKAIAKSCSLVVGGGGFLPICGAEGLDPDSESNENETPLS
jgi:hypothetical protein